MKKILFIGPCLGGGVATINKEVIKIFGGAGYEYGLLDTERMISRLPTPLAYLFSYMISVFKIISFRPRLVYLQLAQTGYLHQSAFLLIAKILGRETVAHFHAKSNLKEACTARQFKRILFSQKYTDRMIVLTGPCKGSLQENGWKKPVYVVPNFINVENLPSSIKPVADRSRILYIGRMDREKGIFEILDVAERLPDERFVFVGDFASRDEERDFTGRLEGADNVEWLGALYGEQKFDIIADSKFLLLPTKRDEFPMTLIESTILGCVPLVSPVGSVGEIIKDGYNGFYISSDDVDEMARKILRWKDDPELRGISENGIDYARKNFTNKVVQNKLLDIAG